MDNSESLKGLTNDANWSDLTSWDKAYYQHGFQADGEATIHAIASMDGNWFTLSDGTKMLDFQSQLISDSFGHRHPAFHGKIKEAMEDYGHAFYGFANKSNVLVNTFFGTEKKWKITGL